MNRTVLSRLAIVVVNYGSSALLEHNLTRVARDAPEAAVVVVDNHTDQRERNRVVELAGDHGWRVVLPETNTGFGGGCNAGAALAIAELDVDFLLFLNPDAVVDRAALEEMLRVLERAGDAFVAPVIRRSDGRIWFDGMEVSLADGTMRKGDGRKDDALAWLTGACLLAPVGLWHELDGFDERYFLYWEDVDLSVRAAKAGADLIVARDAVAVHDAGGTQQDSARVAEAKSPTYYYYSIRNRLLFAALHLDASRYRAWVRTCVPAATAILLRGGKRQFLRSVSPLVSGVRGTWDGLRLGRRVRRARRAEVASPRVVRSYVTVRSAHFERDAGRNVTLVFGEKRYDADDAAAGRVRLRRTGVIGAFWYALTHRIDILEVNEPLHLAATWRSLAMIAGNSLRMLGAQRAAVVTYAIENLDPRESRPRRLRGRVMRGLRMWGARRVWHALSRIAYGTAGSRDLYARVFAAAGGLQQRLISALPAPLIARGESEDRAQKAVFLGHLSPRKGFDDVLDAWAAVLAEVPDAALTIIGKGPGEDQARSAADAQSSVDLIVDPPRARIFEELATAKALVLPSRRTGRWREQVGLPLVEGLGSGCLVVTTDETGLASWLDDHGHYVVREPAVTRDLPTAIVSALRSSRSVDDVLADLPEVDGRRAADAWLTGGGAR